MDSKRFIVKVLLVVIGVLTLVSALIVYRENVTKKKVSFQEIPQIVFRDVIELELDINSVDNDKKMIDHIIVENEGKFDEIIEVTYSRKKTGSYPGVIRVALGEYVRDYHFEYKVTDKTSPKIIVSKELVTTVGEILDFDDYITVTDDSIANNQKIEYSILGEVDWYTAGEYPITIVAVDASQNKTELEVIVKVNEVEYYSLDEPIYNNLNEEESIIENTIINQNTESDDMDSEGQINEEENVADDESNTGVDDTLGGGE